MWNFTSHPNPDPRMKRGKALSNQDSLETQVNVGQPGKWLLFADGRGAGVQGLGPYLSVRLVQCPFVQRGFARALRWLGNVSGIHGRRPLFHHRHGQRHHVRVRVRPARILAAAFRGRLQRFDDFNLRSETAPFRITRVRPIRVEFRVRETAVRGGVPGFPQIEQGVIFGLLSLLLQSLQVQAVHADPGDIQRRPPLLILGELQAIRVLLVWGVVVGRHGAPGRSGVEGMRPVAAASAPRRHLEEVDTDIPKAAGVKAGGPAPVLQRNVQANICSRRIYGCRPFLLRQAKFGDLERWRARAGFFEDIHSRGSGTHSTVSKRMQFNVTPSLWGKSPRGQVFSTSISERCNQKQNSEEIPMSMKALDIYQRYVNKIPLTLTQIPCLNKITNLITTNVLGNNRVS